MLSPYSLSSSGRTYLLAASLWFMTLYLPATVRAQYGSPDPHQALFDESPVPSAASCKTCHPIHYKEWSVSPHAYAVISPVNNAMQGKINVLTNGTNGDFCMRCHTPVGLDMNEDVFMSSMDRHPVAREGITCVVCHRRPIPYGKVSGRMSPEKGDIYSPVYGPHDNSELKRVIESGEYDVNPVRGEEGRAIHADAIEMPQINTSGFCASCHDVNHYTGFRLEEAFSEWKSSPAAARGISCQDCHMGVTPGIPSGFHEEPIAVIGGEPTRPRKRTNHMFTGPDYSIVHPGIFPHNPAAQEIATMREWLQFLYVEGWGTDAFEDNVGADYEFPERWADVADRYEAREIINENLLLLKRAEEDRLTLLKVGYQLGDVIVERADSGGIRFQVQIWNGTSGHNVPTGFDAERLVFLQVTVTDAEGRTVFQSGDLDPNGDVRDLHSVYVHNGELPLDKQLYSLQSRFITRMLRGGDREQVLAVNYSPDPLPFIRPPTQSTLLLGRPADSRKHRQTIPPNAFHWASYRVDKDLLRGYRGPFRADIKLIAGMVPVNLVYEIQDVGFDYGMSPREVADAIVAGHQVLWQKTITLTPGKVSAVSELSTR